MPRERIFFIKKHNTSVNTYGKNHEQIIRKLLSNLYFCAEQAAIDTRQANAELVKYYEEKLAYFAILSVAELIVLKRKSKRNPGWVARRAYYETALTEEMQRRGLQTS